MPKRDAVPVTMRALLQRINRKLAPDEIVKAARTEAQKEMVGSFYRVDLGSSPAPSVNEKHIDLEKLGRKLGVLQPWERIADEG